MAANASRWADLISYTSLDYDLQIQAVCTLQNELARLEGNSSTYLAEGGGPCEAAQLLAAIHPDESLPGARASFLMLDPRAGQILAAVGDMGTAIQGNSLSAHPAGTTITPLIYLTAFSRGFNPASLAWDVPVDLPVPGNVYHGPVRLRTALANDYLIPASQLLDQLSRDSVENISTPLGLAFPVEGQILQDDFDVSPLTLAGTYSVFANEGTQAGRSKVNGEFNATTVLKVSDVNDFVWLDWQAPQNRSVISPQLAYIMNQVLSDESARWPSLGHPNPLEIGRPAAAKLSQSLDEASAWTVGYTPQRVGIVWLGGDNDAGAPEGDLIPTVSAEVWHALMQYALREMPPTSWAMPAGILTLPVCDPSGLLPTAACPNVVSEIFLEGRQPIQADNLYQTFQVNIETGLLATVFTAPELVEARTYMAVPPDKRAWADTAGILAPPTAYDTVQSPPVLENVHLTAPAMFSDGRGKVQITGSAAGADFLSYRLEYGQGLYPRTWIQIGSDSAAPLTEALLGEWDTTGLNGLYALRLMVVRTDRRVEQALVQVTLDNIPPQVAVTYPLEGQVIDRSEEQQVALQVQANDPFLQKVEFLMDGILIGHSTQAPFGLLWDAENGSHTFKAVATDRAGNKTEVTIRFSVE